MSRRADFDALRHDFDWHDGRMAFSDRDRRIIALAIPALGTLAIEPVYILVDTAIVGRLGTDPLAGLAIVGTVLLTVFALFAFMQTAVTTAVAHAIGEGDATESRRVAGDALVLAAMVGTGIMLVLLALATPISSLLGARGAVLDNAVTYLRIAALGAPAVMTAYVGHGVMRGHNDLRRPLLIVTASSIANLVLEIIAVYWLGFGIAGSAWSTTIVQTFAAVGYARLVIARAEVCRPSWARLRPFLLSGVHLGIRSAAMLAVWIAVTRVASGVDTPTLAAHQVLFQLFMFLALILDSLAIPAQSLVAGAVGAGDDREAMAVGWASTRLSIWVGLGLGALLATTSPLVAQLFSSDDAVRSRIASGLILLAVMQLPGAIAFALDGALIGGSDQRFLGRAAVFNLIAFVPFLVATVISPRLGIIGLWGGQLAWMCMRATVNAHRFRSRRWLDAQFNH